MALWPLLCYTETLIRIANRPVFPGTSRHLFPRRLGQHYAKFPVFFQKKMAVGPYILASLFTALQAVANL